MNKSKVRSIKRVVDADGNQTAIFAVRGAKEVSLISANENRLKDIDNRFLVKQLKRINYSGSKLITPSLIQIQHTFSYPQGDITAESILDLFLSPSPD